MVEQQQQQQQQQHQDESTATTTTTKTTASTIALLKKKLEKVNKLLLTEQQQNRENGTTGGVSSSKENYKLEKKRVEYLATLTRIEKEQREEEKEDLAQSGPYTQQQQQQQQQQQELAGDANDCKEVASSAAVVVAEVTHHQQQVEVLQKKIQKVTRLMTEYLNDPKHKTKESSKKFKSFKKKHEEYMNSYNELINQQGAMSTTTTTTTGEEGSITVIKPSHHPRSPTSLKSPAHPQPQPPTSPSTFYSSSSSSSPLISPRSKFAKSKKLQSKSKSLPPSSSSTSPKPNKPNIMQRHNTTGKQNSLQQQMRTLLDEYGYDACHTALLQLYEEDDAVMEIMPLPTTTKTGSFRGIGSGSGNGNGNGTSTSTTSQATTTTTTTSQQSSGRQQQQQQQDPKLQQQQMMMNNDDGYHYLDHVIVEGAIHQPLICINHMGIIQRVNRVALRTLGYDHEEELLFQELDLVIPRNNNNTNNPNKTNNNSSSSSSNSNTNSSRPPLPPKASTASPTTPTMTSSSSSFSPSFVEYYELTEKSHPFSNNQHKAYMIKKNGSHVSVQLSFQAIEKSKKHITTRGSIQHDVRTMELYFICFLRIPTTATNRSTCTGSTTTNQGKEEGTACSSTTIPSSSTTVLSDIHQHANLMELERNMFQKMIDAAFDACFVTNAYGIIQRVNQAGLRKFGYSTDHQLIGENIKIICGDMYAPHHDKWMANYRRTGEANVVGSNQREVRAKRKDGSEFPALLGVRVVEQDSKTGAATMLVGFVRDLTKHKRNIHLEVEQRAAQELLLNMLPETVADRLKQDPGHIADQHKRATVLFADIVGFTAMSSHMEAVDLVVLLNDLFLRFDELVARYKLNKVKTIGDCYMVTDVPTSSESGSIHSCAAVCHFALDMIAGLAQYNLENPDQPLNVRVGIHCGPVVGGIIGSTRFLYDIWGDAVNLASRMESTGLPGQVQVSKDLVAFLVGGVDDNDDTSDGGSSSSIIDPSPTSTTEDFIFKSRGLIPIKGKGELETFIIAQRLTNGCQYYKDDSMSGSFEFNEEQGKKYMNQFDSIRDLRRSFHLPTGGRVSRISSTGVNLLPQYNNSTK